MFTEMKNKSAWIALALLLALLPATANAQLLTTGAGNSGINLCTNPTWINCPVNPLPIFKAAVAATLSASADTTVLVAGDSTTWGVHATSQATAYPAMLATALTTAGYPAQSQNTFSYYSGGVPDARLTVGSGWIGSTSSIGGPMYFNNSTTTAVTFAPVSAFSSFNFYYLDNAQVGAVTVDGSTIDALTAGVTGLPIKKTYSVAAGIHTVGYTRTSGTPFFMGWNANISASKSLGILNAGANGVNSFTWADTATPYSMLNTSLLTLPSLAIVNVGINDWLGTTTPAEYAANMQAMINAFKANSVDVLLVVPVPSSISLASRALQQAIVAQIYALAASNNLVGLDMTKAWGGSFEAANPAFYCGDLIHPCDAGYADEAARLSALLQYVLTHP